MFLTLSRIWRRLSGKRRKKRSGRRSRMRIKLRFDVTSGVLYLRVNVLCDESLYLLKCLFWQKSSNACSSFFFLWGKKRYGHLIKYPFKVGLCDIQNDSLLQDKVQFHDIVNLYNDYFSWIEIKLHHNPVIDSCKYCKFMYNRDVHVLFADTELCYPNLGGGEYPFNIVQL